MYGNFSLDSTFIMDDQRQTQPHVQRRKLLLFAQRIVQNVLVVGTLCEYAYTVLPFFMTRRVVITSNDCDVSYQLSSVSTTDKDRKSRRLCPVYAA